MGEAIMYVTKNEITPVYKPDGAVHGQSPISGAGKQVFTTGTIRNITDRGRGNCYVLTNITNGYVRVSDVEIADSPDPTPGATITHRINVYSDGSITVDGNPYP